MNEPQQDERMVPFRQCSVVELLESLKQEDAIGPSKTLAGRIIREEALNFAMTKLNRRLFREYLQRNNPNVVIALDIAAMEDDYVV